MLATQGAASRVGRSSVSVACVARPNTSRSTRPGPARASPSPAEAPAASPLPAVPAALPASTPVPLPPALQGGVIIQETQDQVEQQAGSKQQRGNGKGEGAGVGAGTQRPGGSEGKRRDRRRRQLAKHRRAKAEVSAAAATVAGAATTAAVAAGTAAAVQLDAEQQRGSRQRSTNRSSRRSSSVGTASGGSSADRYRTPLERQIPITPREEDLKMWYAGVVAAAEQAHRHKLIGKAASQQRRPAGTAAAGAPAAAAAGSKGSSASSFAQTLQAPIKEWMHERLDYMGFEARTFPQLTSLDAALAQRQQQQQGQEGAEQEEQQQAVEQQKSKQQKGEAEAAGKAATASSSSSSSSGVQGEQKDEGSSASVSHTRRSLRGCTTSTFARWAAAPGVELPLLASQWPRGGAGWELGRPERLLHEAHAAHEWSGSAEEHARAMIGMYEEFGLEAAGVPVVAGRLPASASLPGAAVSFTLEAVVGEGHALQVASAHHLADNYSRMLLGSGTSSSTSDDWQEQQEGGEGGQFSQMGSWLQTSLLGGMALTHSDDSGLRLPPALAPVQVLIVPLLHYRCDRGTMAAEAERLRGVLEAAGIRVEVDWRRRGPAGVRFGDGERRGVPLRIELGPRDLRDRTCVIARRDQPGRGGKLEGVSSDPDALVDTVRDLLDDAQSDLRWGAASVLQEAIVDVSSFMELRDVIEAGKWARGPWAGSPEDEAEVFRETGASLRCFPLAQPASLWGGFHTCLYSGYQASEVAIFARPLV